MVTEYPSDAAERGKPTVVIDHASIAPAEGGVVVMLTLSIRLDDLHALDLMLRAVGAIARRRSAGVVP